MNSANEAACAICGAEHDVDETPEVDSTHLCADCARTQRRLMATNIIVTTNIASR